MSSVSQRSPSKSSCTVAICWLALACGSRGMDRKSAIEATLPPGVVALVGDREIGAAEARLVATRKHIEPAAALDYVVKDELLASHVATPSGAERVSLARTMLYRFREHAVAQGVPTAEELDAELERRWWEIDRPEMRRALHMVVVTEEGDDKRAARAHAEKVYEAVKNAKTGVEFREQAKTVDKGSHNVVVQDLPPVTLDGRALEMARGVAPGTKASHFHVEFARPLFEIAHVLGVSPVFESPSGFHVAMLTQIIPESRLGKEELNQLLVKQVYDARAAIVVGEFLTHARKTQSPQMELDALSLMDLVVVAHAPEEVPTGPVGAL